MAKYLLPTLISLGSLLALPAGAQQAKDTATIGAIAVNPKEVSAQLGPIGIKASGFVRHDVSWDSRQIISAREGSVLLWPKDNVPDSEGKDINAANTFHMLAIISRISGAITGPDVLGAKTSGLFEAEFFGNIDADINELRLRHAWIKLDWKNTQLGLGQYWHPLITMDCYPGVVNFSTGAPFMPFNRNPQIRLTQKLGSYVNIALSAISQRDFTSNTEPYRNSGVPALNIHGQFKTSSFLFGASAHYENLRPKLSGGDPVLVSNERVNSFSFEAYTKITTKPLIIKAEAFKGQNAASFVMLGGFLGYTLPGMRETYQTMNTTAYWLDINGTGKKIVPGLFVGYTATSGTKDSVAGAIVAAYGLPAALGAVNAGTTKRTINYMYRVAPRVEFLLKKLKFGLEAEYSAAEWGDADATGVAVANKSLVSNMRILWTTVLSF